MVQHLALVTVAAVVVLVALSTQRALRSPLLPFTPSQSVRAVLVVSQVQADLPEVIHRSQV